MRNSFDDCDRGPFRFLLKFGALAILANIVIWGCIITMVAIAIKFLGWA